MTKRQRTALIIDDTPEDRVMMQRILARDPSVTYHCVEASTAAEGLERCRAQPPDVILLDYWLPGDDGLLCLAALLAEHGPFAFAVLMIVGIANEAVAVQSLKLGAHDYLVKEYDFQNRLLPAIISAIDKVQLQRRLEQQRSDLEQRHQQLQQALAAQQASASQLALALQATGMSTWEWDIAADQVRWGPGLEAMVGLAPGTFGGSPAAFFALVHPDDRAHVRLALDQALRADQPYDVMFRMVRPDGSLRWCTSRAHVVRDAHGRPQRMHGIDIDITARRQQEAEHQASEERRRVIWEAASDAMALSDAEGIVLDANSAYCALYSYTPAQVIGQSFAIIFPPEQRAWAIEEYRKIVRARAAQPAYESVIQRADGERRVVESRATFVALGDGQTGLLSIIRDITDRTRAKDAQARLLKQERMARAAAEQAADYAARLQQVSAALMSALTPAQVAKIILDQGLAALTAHAGTVVVHTDDRTHLEVLQAVGYPPGVVQQWQRFPLTSATPLSEAVRTGQPVMLESRAAGLARFPELATVERVFGDGAILAFPLRASEQVIGGLGVSFHEPRTFGTDAIAFITRLVQQCAHALERAQLYQAAQRARAEAQEAVRVRDAFLSTAAHELRNPLTTLLGHAQLLARRAARAGAGAERDLRSVTLIAEQAARMNDLIGLLLDVTRLETGQLQLQLAPLDLGALIERVCDELRPTLARHTLAWQPPAHPLWVAGDALRLTQVLQNLLSNAVKYSPQGGAVTLALTHDGALARVAIGDQGIGIPPEALPKLFQRFYRAENTEATLISGIGVGLYVVKEIVTLHGGEVAITSSVGQGSTVTVTLPLIADPSAPAGMASPLI